MARTASITSCFKKLWVRYLSRPFTPLCASKVRWLGPTRNIPSLIRFAFTACHGLLAPAQVKSEITRVAERVAKLKPTAAMEIGTAHGGTLLILAHLAARDATIISLDLPGGRFGGGYPRWKIPLYKSFAKGRQSITLLREDSHKEDTMRKAKEALGKRKLDFLLIDGDHTYEGVKRDFNLYKGLVKKGGLIAFHDIVRHPPETGCEVHKFWKEVKKKHEHEEIIADRNQGWAGIGVITV